MMLCQLSAILGFQGCGTSVVLRWLYAQMQLSKRLKLQEKLRESFAAQQRADLTEAEGEPTGRPHWSRRAQAPGRGERRQQHSTKPSGKQDFLSGEERDSAERTARADIQNTR